MGDTPDQQAAGGDVDHGFGHVEALLVIRDEAAQSGHPAELSFDDPAVRQHLEARLLVTAANNFQNEIAVVSTGIEQFGASIW